MPSKQATFDRCVRGVLRQGKPSISKDMERCKYRGPGGMKCAVGFLMTDEEYRPNWDRKDNDSTVDSSGPVRKLMESKGHDIGLLYRLQRAHDSSSYFGVFIDRFRWCAVETAKDFGLDTSVLNGEYGKAKAKADKLAAVT